MKTVLMNMVMIYNEDTEEVLVLDKVKKEGWEGLTFPGGHVEANESFQESAIREIYEETNLIVSNLEFVGFVQWIDSFSRQVGILYRTVDFQGQLVQANIEGQLFWISYKKFLTMPNKSDAMDEILNIYEGKYQEIVFTYDDNNRKGMKYLE